VDQLRESLLDRPVGVEIEQGKTDSFVNELRDKHAELPSWSRSTTGSPDTLAMSRRAGLATSRFGVRACSIPFALQRANS
jgi:hypothetical protein